MSSRRDFLKTSGMVVMGGAAGYLTTDQILAQSQDSSQSAGTGESGPDWSTRPTLVTIFLRGGADALHALIPFGDDQYYNYRPGIAVPVNKAQNKDSALRIGKSTYWGINPHMKELLPLMEEGSVVPIINVGSPHGTRSHFSAQDYMERAAPGNDRVTQGWLNRYLEASRKPYDAPLRGLSAMSLVPRSLRGKYPVLAGNNRTERMDMFEELYANDNLVNMTAREGAGTRKGSSLEDRPGSGSNDKKLRTEEAVRDIITESGTNAVERIKALEKASKQQNTGKYPGGGLAAQLKTIAKVIKAEVGLEVAQADYGGWDHHANQGGVHGRTSQMLGHLVECMTAFREDLGPRMDKVCVLVMSEFGRTLHENGNSGTDHGRGGFMLAMGNMMKGGKIYGEWNGIEDANYGRFQPVHTDFRNVFAESISKLFHFDPFKARLFPDYRGSHLDYIDYMEQLKEI